MALFRNGMSCPICRKPMSSNDPLFSTWGVWLPASDALHGFCDACMHWSCYADWPFRARFARTYVDFWVEHEESDPFWHRVFLDDACLVTVNPELDAGSAWVCLYETGTRVSVGLSEWEQWLAKDRPEGRHLVESDAIDAAKAILVRALPTAAAVREGIDLRAKHEAIESWERHQESVAKEEQTRLERVRSVNEETDRLHSLAVKRGITCNHCGVTGGELKLSRGSDKNISLVICRGCGWTVPIEDLRKQLGRGA